MFNKGEVEQVMLCNEAERELISGDSLGAVPIGNPNCGLKINVFDKEAQLSGRIGRGRSFYSKLITAKGVAR